MVKTCVFTVFCACGRGGKAGYMLLHLGENKAVMLKDVILIMNMENALQSPVNREFLEIARDERRVVSIAEPAKTLVLAGSRASSTAYLSPVSGNTLCRRGEDNTIEYE